MTYIGYAICMYFYIELLNLKSRRDVILFWATIYGLAILLTLLVKPYLGGFLMLNRYMVDGVDAFVHVSSAEALLVAFIMAIYFFVTAKIFQKLRRHGAQKGLLLVLALLPGGLLATFVAWTLVVSLGAVVPV